MAISHCMVYQIPPQSFQLPCVQPQKISNFSLSPEIVENSPSSNKEHGTSKINATALAAEDKFLCCHWSEIYINCFIYTAEMEARTLTYSEPGALSSHQIGVVVEDFKFFIVMIYSDYLRSTIVAFKNKKFSFFLFQFRTDVSLEATSTHSLKDNFTVTHCNSIRDQKYACQISSVKLNHTYIMWLKITNGIALLQSPLMSVKPIDIGKIHFIAGPDCFLSGIPLFSEWCCLRYFMYVMYFPQKILASVGTNVSFYCISKTKDRIISSRKIIWWLNLAKEIPRSQYTIVNDYISKVTLVNLSAMNPGGKFLFNALYCCNENKECNHHYAELYIIDVNISITCETDGNLQKMTCRWFTNGDPLLSECTLLLRYYRSDVYCSESPTISSYSKIKECQPQRNNSYECIFQPFYLLSGYTMWIEIKHSLGTVTSQPVCILPKEVVKPFSPSNVKAEITEEVGLLLVRWNNPEFPKYDLQFQIRYAANGTKINWEMQEISTPSVSSAIVIVPDPCTVYIVQVRCSLTDGVGYWSDWSRPAYTVIKDIKAPLRGPEFWRIVDEDPVTNQNNVTLFWKPLMKNLSLCSVLGYMVEHTTSDNVTWSDYVENDTTYTFSWAEDVHTIKVIAINSIGASSVNFILTLSKQMSTVNIVESLRIYPVNSSCVIVTWTLSPVSYIITSFVIEWINLNGEEQIKWIMVPSDIRRHHIFDNFILIDKYRFSLYPITCEGVMKPYVTDGFSKGEMENHNDVNVYVILPLVISCSVLLFGGFLILHQRMKTLFWDDVPNPKNCSWAQGVNFQKPETFEHLFLKHPEALSFGPLLLEPEIVLEDVTIDKARNNEEKQDLRAIDSLFATIQDLEHDSACSSGHFNSASLSESVCDVETSRGMTGQSNVKYATIITNSMSGGLYEPPKDLSSSLDRGFIGHHSLASASFSSSSWAMGNQGFVILPECHQTLPRKSLSLSVSSEGFSELSEQDKAFTGEDSLEGGMFYLGMSPFERQETDLFLTESSNMACQFHTSALIGSIRFPQNIASNLNLNPFISRHETSVQTFISYMPQFQPLAIKLHEKAGGKA
uniref:Leptin receptor n=1 Tax=Anolis carolinensis TaxID=28377 RepID=A0A803SWQ4_ANOCA